MKIIDTPESRTFPYNEIDGSVAYVRIRRANRREAELSDLEQSRVFNQGLLAGLPPRSRLLRKLQEQELWTEADAHRMEDTRQAVAVADARVGELTEQIEKIRALPGFDNDSVSQSQVKELEAQREVATDERVKQFNIVRDLRVEIDGMLGHTADAKAETSQRNFLIACVTEFVEVIDGKVTKVLGRVYPSVDELLGTNDFALLERVIYEYITFNAGIPSERADNKPAAKATQPESKAAEPKAELKTEAPEVIPTVTHTPEIAKAINT